MKQFSITLLLLFGWLGAAAQHDLYNWQLKGYTGIANYYNTGKSTGDYFDASDNLLYRLEIGRSLGHTFGLAASASYGNVRGLGQAGSAFTTQARMVALRLYFYTDNGWMFNTSAAVSPFFFGGYGLSTLQTTYNGASDETKYMRVVPFGLGLKFRLAEKWQLDLHTEAVYNTKSHLAPIAMEQNKYNNTFLHTGLSLAYSFGFKKSTFKAPRLYVGTLDPLSSPGPVNPPNRSMLDFVLELTPRRVQLKDQSMEDSLMQAPRHVPPVAAPPAPPLSINRLGQSDSIPAVPIDSLQLMQDTVGLRSKAVLTQLPDSVQVDSLRRVAASEEGIARTDTVRATAAERSAIATGRAQTIQADSAQPAPDSVMAADMLSNERLMQQAARLRQREQDVRKREQDVRDREQDAREKEQDARQRELDARDGITTKTRTTIQERVPKDTVRQLAPVKRQELARAQEPERTDAQQQENLARVQAPARKTEEQQRAVDMPDPRTEPAVRVDSGRARQVEPSALLLLERDKRDLETANRNNQELRRALDSLQTATAADTRLIEQQVRQDAAINPVAGKMLVYMEEQARLNDSIMQRLELYESELRRLRTVEAPTPEPAPIEAYNTSVFFQLNAFKVPVANFNELLGIATVLKENPDLKLKLTGYTDQSGDPTYNMALSRKRAAAVSEFFQEQGIEKERIISEHLGEAKSTGGVNPAERRVTVEIME